MGLAETAELAVRISLKDGISGGVRGIQKNLGSLNSSLARTGKGVGQIGAGIARAGLVIGTALAGGLTAAAKAGADFESQLNTINTIAMTTPEALQGIGDGIRELARQGKGDLADLSAGFYDILSAGITDTAKAQGVLKAATDLSIGGLSTNAQAVDLLTTAINAYHQDASQATADADLFAKAIELGKVKADAIASSIAAVAPIAAATGIKIQEIAASYAALTAQGTAAAEVPTQMARSIIELLKPSKDVIKLQDKMHVNYMALAKQKGLGLALQQMRADAEKANIPFIKLFKRVEAYKYALQVTGPNQKTYNDALAAMGNSAGTAAAQMGERTKGLNFQLARLKNNLIDAGITLSQGFLPQLAASLDKMSTALGMEGTKSRLKAIGEDIGHAIDGIDWNAVLAGAESLVSVLKGALSFAKLLYDAFSTLPGPIKEAAAGFLVLNKLSGNLIASGAGNIIGGLGGVIAKSAGSRLPVVGALFAQPVFVTNWPLGGVGGGLPGVLGGAGAAAGGVTVAGLAAAAIPIAAAAAIVIATSQNKGKYDPRSLRERQYTTVADTLTIGGFSGKAVDDLHRIATPIPADQRNFDRYEAAVARGVEKGLIHSGVFKKAETIRKAGGFKLSLDALKADLHRGGLGSDALVTGQAIALSAGNKLRTTPGGASLATARYDIGLLTRLMSKLPADLAAKLGIKLASLEATFKAAAAAINARTEHPGKTKDDLALVVGNIKPPVVTVQPPIVNVNVHVTASQVTKTITIQNRYGPGNGSRGNKGVKLANEFT